MTSEKVMFDKKRIARLKWACRRGMVELDVLLLPFVEGPCTELDDQDKLVFERLLACDDPDLFAWFMGHAQCQDPQLARMVHVILDRSQL